MSKVLMVSGREISDVLIGLVEKAQVSIDILVFDWRWYANDPGASIQLFNQTLVRAVRRGVKVRCVLNSDEVVDILKGVGVEAKKNPTKNKIHCKLMIVDKSVCVLGSHNYTAAAFTINHELSVMFDDDEAVTRALSFFENLFVQNDTRS
jgi:phosphatidylserine/phosphatidylglycerophosphate/cardiolipin synthase-like enzyme